MQLDSFAPFFHPRWRGALGLYAKPGDMGFTCDNYHLITATLYNLCRINDEPVPAPLVRSTATFIEACTRGNGDFRRFPDRQGEISQDELVGICFFAWLIGYQELAQMIAFHGFQTDWVWKPDGVTRWRWTDWLARHGYFVPFVRACAGMPVGGFSQLLWCVWTVASCLSPKGDTSGKLMQWLQFPVMRKYPSCSLVISVWTFVMRAKYPGGSREAARIYFKDHPIVEAFPADWNVTDRRLTING